MLLLPGVLPRPTARGPPIPARRRRAPRGTRVRLEIRTKFRRAGQERARSTLRAERKASRRLVPAQVALAGDFDVPVRLVYDEPRGRGKIELLRTGDREVTFFQKGEYYSCYS